MQTKEIFEQTENSVLHTYNRFPVAFERGEGMNLIDTDGKEYLDFGAGIAVCALGYSDPAIIGMLKEQAERIWHTSNLYYHPMLSQAGSALARVSKMDKVFFTNSGTEAIEGAIKAAKKYAFLRDGHAGHEVIAMEHSFHGRSIGALSVTGNAHYQEPFLPLMGGVRFAKFNDIESVKTQVTEKTCAIIMETVQGEGGIYPAEERFLREVRALCDEKDILLILDEIQCGMGRCGDWFAWQCYGIAPDIMTSAKGLGCGMPVGAFLLNRKTAAASLAPGDHGTTYGGNPLACAVVKSVIDRFEELSLIDHVKETAPYFEEVLDQLVADFDILACRRGMGMMQGLVVKDIPVGKIASAALENGLVILTAGSDVLRLVPPLIAGKAEIDEMAKRLSKTLIAMKES